MTLARFVNPWAWIARGPADRAYEAATDVAFRAECDRELQRWRDWLAGDLEIATPEPKPIAPMFDFMLDDEEEP